MTLYSLFLKGDLGEYFNMFDIHLLTLISILDSIQKIQFSTKRIYFKVVLDCILDFRCHHFF